LEQGAGQALEGSTLRDAALSARAVEAVAGKRALDARLAEVEQARQQYESALPILLSKLQTSYAGEFADIQSVADVQRLATERLRFWTPRDGYEKEPDKTLHLAGVKARSRE
jgi:hypothetical protein